MRAVIYNRISADRYGEEAGVERQLGLCEQLLQRRPDLDLIPGGVYQDNDISALHGDLRPAYEEMLGAIRAGEAQVIITYMLSRLWRNGKERAEGFDLMVKAEGRIECVSGSSYDFTEPQQVAMASVQGAFDTLESAIKSQRVKDWQLWRTLRGEYSGARPFGFEKVTVTIDGVHGSSLVIAEDEASLIREAAEAIIEHDTALEVIAREWNDRGIRTAERNGIKRQRGKATRRAGIEWSGSTIGKLMVAPRNAGLRITRSGVTHPGSWEPILDAETWKAVCAVLSNPARNTYPDRVGNGRIYLLSGLLSCGACGARLVVALNHSPKIRNDHVYRYYACPDRPGWPGCGKVSRPMEQIDALILEHVIGWRELFEEEELRIQKQREQTEGDPGHLAGRHALVRQRLEELDAAAADPDPARQIAFGDYNRLKAPLEAEAADLLARLRRRTTTHKLLGVPFGTKLRTVWETYELDERRKIITALIEKIELHPAADKYTFHPGEVKVIPGAWAADADLSQLEIPAGHPVVLNPRRVNGRDVQRKVLGYMRDHPDRELSPAEISDALGFADGFAEREQAYIYKSDSYSTPEGYARMKGGQKVAAALKQLVAQGEVVCVKPFHQAPARPKAGPTNQRWAPTMGRDELRAEIIRLREQGLIFKEIGERVGCAPGWAAMVARGVLPYRRNGGWNMSRYRLASTTPEQAAS